MKDDSETDEYDAPSMEDSLAKHQAHIPELTPGMMSHPYFGMLGDQGSAAEEGSEASAGSPLEAGTAKANAEQVIAALCSVYDPEIPVNIYDLGLIYQQEILENGNCKILMTLTAPACPVAGEMPAQVAEAVAGVEGIGVVTVTLTWFPAWDQSMMSEDAKMALDIW